MGVLLADITLEIGASGSRILDIVEGISLVRDVKSKTKSWSLECQG